MLDGKMSKTRVGILTVVFLFFLIYLRIPNIMRHTNGTTMYSSQHYFPKATKLELPVCENILSNMTNGQWVRKIDRLLPTARKEREGLILKEANLERELLEYWRETGILLNYSRSDNQCGYNSLAEQPPQSKWPRVGSWCNASSERPCCSNKMRGVCMPPTYDSCNCEKCVDSRKYKHPDVSDWIVDDVRCKWKNYSRSEACDVIEKSPFEELIFVGDSFMRNMFRTFLILLTGDPIRGSFCSPITEQIKQRCTGNHQFFRTECRLNPTDLANILSTDALCGGRRKVNFKAYMKCFYSNAYKKQFYDLATSKIGKEGTLVILSIGSHVACSSTQVISQYLGPVMEAIRQTYSDSMNASYKQHTLRWPHVILLLPPTVGLLKPLQYMNHDLACVQYAEDMKEYAKKFDIPVIDMRQLISFVHSFDGTHNGLNVNLMKNQLLLNYIAKFTMTYQNAR